jgi:NAD(P)-dependent dehydrogenase (short-subunit alcohol dehydrogenase family)
MADDSNPPTGQPTDIAEQFDLSGDIAVVTGASRGIGRAIAIGLGEAGATVVPTARTESALEETVSRIEAVGGTGLAVSSDVSEQHSVEALFDRTVEEFGGVDVLVNNAGMNPDSALGKPETIDIDGFDGTIAVNLRGAFLCAQTAAEYLQDGTSGSVINIASVAGVVGLPRQHPYVASKHGLVGMTKSMALDWAPDVRVNAIAPGYVETEFIDEALESDSIRQSLLDQTPLDRFAAPEEMAGPAVFLSSEASSYVTGSCLTVDGGWTAK